MFDDEMAYDNSSFQNYEEAVVEAMEEYASEVLAQKKDELRKWVNDKPTNLILKEAIIEQINKL